MTVLTSFKMDSSIDGERDLISPQSEMQGFLKSSDPCIFHPIGHRCGDNGSPGDD